jgi:hypothetical protein
MSKKFDFEATLKAIQSGQPIMTCLTCGSTTFSRLGMPRELSSSASTPPFSIHVSDQVEKKTYFSQ